MKKSIAILAVLVAITSAFAGPDKPLPKKGHCSVMTHDVIDLKEATTAKRFQDYKGRRYFFCCPTCQAAFKKSPEKYSKNESFPIPAEKAAPAPVQPKG